MIVIPKRNRNKVNADINVVPYIDVMLVLLVIFIMASPIVEQGVEIDLPQTDSEIIEYVEKKRSIVTVDKNGNYYMNTLDNYADVSNNEVVNINEVISMIIARLNIYPNMQVFIRGDVGVAYGSVVELLSLLEPYIDNVGLVTETPE